jgi:Ternary complex associated domain 7
MVLMDTWSVAAVTTALDGLADRSLVVIRRDEADLAIYYALDVGSVRMALHEVDPEADLTSALGLSVFPPITSSTWKTLPSSRSRPRGSCVPATS